MNLEEIIVIEPRIVDLMNEAQQVVKDKKLVRYERERFWYHDMKHRMMKLVGFGAENPVLNSTDVYDTVYFMLIKLLKI